jgi:hypothetical protein
VWEKKVLLFLHEVVLPMRVMPRETLSAEDSLTRRRERAAARKVKSRNKRAGVPAAAAQGGTAGTGQPKRRKTGQTETGKGWEGAREAENSSEDEAVEVRAPSTLISPLTLLQGSTSPDGRPLAPDSVESGYVSALCALYDDQRVAECNPYPHPRGKALKALMERLQIDWAAETRRNFEDRAINGLKDGYTLAELRSLSGKILAGEGGLAGAEPLALLRTRLDFLLLHSMMLRGESSRSAELSDLCAVRLLNEGDMACLAVVMRITTGKTIALKDGGSSRKTHYSGFLRHRDVLLCPVAALAQWLVYRWEIAREAVPVFADRSSWYETKLLPGSLKTPKKAISAVTQADWIKRALGDSPIMS